MKNRSIRVGFTIVELAIVLVVIGVLLSMVMKGKQLIHTARMKAEVAKVYKFEAAFNIYFAIYGDGTPPPPRNPGWAQFDLSRFFEKGLFSQKDLDYSLLDDDTFWDFGNCRKVDGTYELSGTDICVQPTNGASRSIQTRAFHFELLCNMEVLLDDEDLLGGRGTLHNSPVWQYGERINADFTDAEYADCGSLWPKVGGNYLYSLGSIGFTPL